MWMGKRNENGGNFSRVHLSYTNCTIYRLNFAIELQPQREFALLKYHLNTTVQISAGMVL